MDRPTNTDPPSPSQRATALAEALVGTLRVAHALAQARRSVDLAGLDQDIGRLCAAALDLPTAEGQAMRGTLATVQAELDALSACLAALAEDEA